MSLVEEVEQFLYTHPAQHHKKELLDLIRRAEDHYLDRIAELESGQRVGNATNPIKLDLSEFEDILRDGPTDSEWNSTYDSD